MMCFSRLACILLAEVGKDYANLQMIIQRDSYGVECVVSARNEVEKNKQGDAKKHQGEGGDEV